MEQQEQAACLAVFTQSSAGQVPQYHIPCGLKGHLCTEGDSAAPTSSSLFSNSPWTKFTLRRVIQGHNISQDPINRGETLLKKWSLPCSRLSIFVQQDSWLEKVKSLHRFQLSHLKPISSLCSPLHPSRQEKADHYLHPFMTQMVSPILTLLSRPKSFTEPQEEGQLAVTASLPFLHPNLTMTTVTFQSYPHLAS